QEDEEDSESEVDSEEDPGDGYGSDLLGEGEDREAMIALPEVERERIVFERFQKRQQHKEQVALRKRLQKNKART
ncbi:unnamed protein product, partial [Ectocarpus sp. 12 AP-2014]